MTQRQKRILLIFGVLNLAVILLLGTIVLRDRLAPPPPIVITVTICEQNLLDVFSPAMQPALDWTPHRLHLHLETPASPETESAQLVWPILDTLAQFFQAGCPIPETLVLALAVNDGPYTHRHLVQIAGEDLAAWMRGEVNDDTLAARARYRHIAPAPYP